MQNKPNILIFFTDQHRYDAVGCNGATICRTLAIDNLAAQGMRFTNAFTPIALCTPARGSLLSGQYPHNHGQLANMGNFNGVFDHQILDKPTFLPRLRQVGYQTGWVGKWHLPNEMDSNIWGIDRWHSFRDWHEWLEKSDYDFERDEVQRLEWGSDAPFAGCSTLPAEKMREAWIADRTIDLIKEFSTSKQPFALTASMFGPHFPYSVPAPYDAMYDPKQIPRPANFDENFDNKPILQEKELLRWNTGHLTWPDWQKVIATYWGFCTFIDDQINRVLEALEKSGMADNTIVIFTCDHGDMLGNHRLFNKGFNMYDETHHIPFIIRAPGITEPGSVCDAFVSLVDIAPTLTDLCGGTSLEGADGRSLTPWLHGETVSDWPETAYSEFHGYESTLISIRMVRTNKWKYIYNPASVDELYDLESDPGELHNLADQLGFKHVLRRMKEKLLQRLNETGDTIAEDDDWKGSSYDLYLSRREQ
jgi:choline-sulfatase